MKKQVLGILFLFVLTVCASAQTTDKTVEKIRAHYNDVAEKAQMAQSDADQGQFGELVFNELNVNTGNHQWRAVGIYNLSYKFFYKGGDTEAHMYPDKLVFVTVDKKISSREYKEEYLYSDAGVLMFYSQTAENDDQTPAKRLAYFSAAKPIRIVEDGKTRDKLTAKDTATIKEITGQSRKIKEVFLKSINL
ncbi:hypothetical protein BH10ACI3_BH10ACI3_08310 [soil metagenome]